MINGARQLSPFHNPPPPRQDLGGSIDPPPPLKARYAQWPLPASVREPTAKSPTTENHMQKPDVLGKSTGHTTRMGHVCNLCKDRCGCRLHSTPCKLVRPNQKNLHTMHNATPCVMRVPWQEVARRCGWVNGGFRDPCYQIGAEYPRPECKPGPTRRSQLDIPTVPCGCGVRGWGEALHRQGWGIHGTFSNWSHEHVPRQGKPGESLGTKVVGEKNRHCNIYTVRMMGDITHRAVPGPALCAHHGMQKSRIILLCLNCCVLLGVGWGAALRNALRTPYGGIPPYLSARVVTLGSENNKHNLFERNRRYIGPSMSSVVLRVIRSTENKHVHQLRGNPCMAHYV